MTKLSNKAVASIKNMNKERNLQRRAGTIKRIMIQKNCSLDDACTIYEQKVKQQFGNVPADVQTDLTNIRQRSEAWFASIGMIAL